MGACLWLEEVRERSEIRQDIEGHGNDFSFHPG